MSEAKMNDICCECGRPAYTHHDHLDADGRRWPNAPTAQWEMKANDMKANDAIYLAEKAEYYAKEVEAGRTTALGALCAMAVDGFDYCVATVAFRGSAKLVAMKHRRALDRLGSK